MRGGDTAPNATGRTGQGGPPPRWSVGRRVDRTAPGTVGRVDVVELAVHGLAVGGEGVGRDEGGRVVFVAGAVPGDRVQVRITEARKRYARGELVAVTTPSPTRVEPPCPQVARGCGGCSLQHLALAEQRERKRQLVLDALVRIGRLTDPEVLLGQALPAEGFRTTLRVAISHGRAGFRRARSHDTVTVPHCLVAHALLDELVAEGRFGDATEASLRVGARTGERLVVVEPTAVGVRLPADVVVVGADELDAGAAAAYHEVAGGRRFRISARSFFQTRADGADLLVDRVAAALSAHATATGAPPGHLVDAYGGVGLLSAAGHRVGAGRTTLVEANPSSTADARHNLADLGAEVVTSPVERWRPTPADVVVADPSRRGLGEAAAQVVAGTGAGLVVLVSCDAGSLGRDAALLGARGYRLERSEVLDLFPHTAHVEVVSTFRRY